ncbi:MAG: sigma-54-dependent Fis family transcriptional regulator, partial [Planctomycetota bacterium]|nr:sigma-54-dependent Fis family transcriptional regulator [Planctomycetota bacterium]
PVVPPDLLGRLEAHPWPGNVRELQAYAARYLIVGPHLPGDDAPRRDDAPGLSLELRLGDGASLELRDARARFDRAYLAAVLARFEGNVTLAARALGMNRSHLSVLVSRYDLRR